MKRPFGEPALARARQLRRDQTDAEARLWAGLRGGRMGGWKFRRQVWIAGFIADFACVEARLIVEADGGQHCDSAGDVTRTTALNREGFRVLRFWNHQILEETSGVMNTIFAALGGERGAAGPHPPTASRRAPPSPRTGEGL
ncbi:MAG: DUF559 domain-containing protein [Sphingomonadales bacterium]|jgi:very-short-patch-repair endonuclease